MRIVAEAFEKLPHVLVDVRVERDVVLELIVFLLIGQLAVAKQPCDFQEGRIFGQLLDGISAIAKDSLVAVDESDGTPAGGSVEEGGVVAYKAVVVRIGGLDVL